MLFSVNRKKIKTSSITSIIVSVLILGILGSAQDVMAQGMMEDSKKEEIKGDDTKKDEAMGGDTKKDDAMGGDTKKDEGMGGDTKKDEAMGGDTKKDEAMGGDTMAEVTDGGCLIATAAFGSELAPQVQFLREVRDNTLLSTTSGATFMTGFYHIYYSFSPAVADLERENPAFREAVKLFITPMLSTLSIMTLADEGSESQVLGLGISVIALNLGMYIAAPTITALKIRKLIKSRI